MLSGTSPLEESLSEGGCPQGVAPSLPGDTAVEQTLLAAALGSSQNASAVAREGVIPLPLNSGFQLCAAEGLPSIDQAAAVAVSSVVAMLAGNASAPDTVARDSDMAPSVTTGGAPVQGATSSSGISMVGDDINRQPVSCTHDQNHTTQPAECPIDGVPALDQEVQCPLSSTTPPAQLPAPLSTQDALMQAPHPPVVAAPCEDTDSITRVASEAAVVIGNHMVDSNAERAQHELGLQAPAEPEDVQGLPAGNDLAPLDDDVRGR